MLTTTPATTLSSMLLLSTYKPSNTPRMIGTEGELSVAFDLKDDEVYRSCGVSHENEFFIYGGDRGPRKQILKLANCSLKRIGTLEFVHERGAWSSSNGKIVLCFGADSGSESKQCRQTSS